MTYRKLRAIDAIRKEPKICNSLIIDRFTNVFALGSESIAREVIQLAETMRTKMQKNSL